MAHLEHVNITVRNPEETAAWLMELFGWEIRWKGDAMNGGMTVHVGIDESYVALYSPNKPLDEGGSSYVTMAGLNHIGVVVDDLDVTEKRAISMGFTPHNHGNYEPGRRFYFDDHDGVEWEVVSYN